MSTVELTDDERAFLEQFKDELAVSTDPELTKYMTGKLLIALTQNGGFTLERAWRILRPTSTSTGHAARQQVHRFIKHHLAKYPLRINEVWI